MRDIERGAPGSFGPIPSAFANRRSAATTSPNALISNRNPAGIIAPHLPGVTWQVAHEDRSPFNIFLTDRNDVAFIGFGDGALGPRLQDLAIAASHFVRDPARSLGRRGTFRRRLRLRAALTVTVTLSTIGTMKAFELFFILTRGGPDGATRMVSLQIVETPFGDDRSGPARAISIVRLAVVLAIALVQKHYFRRRTMQS